MRSDLIETFKIVNRKYTILILIFFRLGESDRRDHKLIKKRFRLNVRKYAFSNRFTVLIIEICCLPIVLTAALNNFKKHLLSELESEAVKFKVSQL